MAFNSLSYFLFLPVVYLIFFITPDRWRWMTLLCASYGFYASLNAPHLLAVLFMVTGISYACGMAMASQQHESMRRRWLWIGSFACVGILALLKYLPFLQIQADSIFGLESSLSSALSSIGVSYFCFQAISYLADVYLEIEEPEQHFGHYALYMAFFPKVLQGPIERAGDLLPQLKKRFEFDYDATRSGMLLFSLGLFKKTVVADRLALYVNPVYNDVHSYTGIPLIMATYAYALQIYFDFSAYTDMARGTARVFGIDLAENFKSPYLSTSIAEFWRRWHISFSRWILDYIFKPLQMSWRDWGQAGTALALLLAFLVSGIWHGSTWNFVVWGLLHGLYLATSTFYRPYQKRAYKWLGIDKSNLVRPWQIFVTFNLVSFAWIFFRSRNIADAFYIINNMGNLSSNYEFVLSNGLKQFIKVNMILGTTRFDIGVLLVSPCLVYTCVWLVNSKKIWVRWPTYYTMALVTYFFSTSSLGQFIYFKF